MLNKSYSELMQLLTWEERLNYLFLGDNKVGDITFGGHRYLNQELYNSLEWKRVRRDIIVRDYGCDMGLIDYPIPNRSKIIIHHINPITINDLLNRSSIIFDPENLISVSPKTHRMIHYEMSEVNKATFNLTGDRVENDTKLW